MHLALTPREREQQLGLWVANELSCSPENINLVPIASDAGFRRYFRFATPSQWLAVDAPPQTEDTHQFVSLARYLSANKVNTPKILAADEKVGFLLVTDFGDDLLYRTLTPASFEARYRQTFNTLLSLQACPDQPTLIPRYDRALLRRELDLFTEWFADKLLGYPLQDNELQMLNAFFINLEKSALEQPQTLVHRDFHSRNLLMCDNGNIGVIDFQGALWGGWTYDLVSLLKDCYIRWPADQIRGLALEYYVTAVNAGLLDQRLNQRTYLRWFDWMGLQRHVKVLGIFARLHLRDNKPHYLKDLTLVIRYTLEVAQAYPELTPFADWFCAKLLPLIEQQSWYSDYRLAGDSQ
jgi:N-acetylmuramate 1-kinase